MIHTYSYSYDSDSRLTAASDSAAADYYTYDALDRVTSETQTIAGLSPSVALSRQYDAAGRLTQLSATVGGTGDFVNDYEYDNADEMTRVTQGGV